jgi:hypothetical protein
MWTIIILGYFVGVFLLIRFFKAVHNWDDEIKAMEGKRDPCSTCNKIYNCVFRKNDNMFKCLKVSAIHYRPAS